MKNREYASPMKIGLDETIHLFGEKIIKTYKDEYDYIYYMTKGFNRYYLYKQQLNKNNYSTVAETKPAINRYIMDNHLQEVI